MLFFKLPALGGERKRTGLWPFFESSDENDRATPGDGSFPMKQPVSKLVVYETLSGLNQRFGQTLLDLHRVQELGLVRRGIIGALQDVLEETRAWANFEMIEVLHEREQADWARFGRLRRQWERKYEDPNDVFVQVRRLKEPRSRAATTKNTTKRPQKG